MKEELIGFETAKLAKEKGFDIEVLNHYEEAERSLEMFQDDVKNSELEPFEYSAPTQSLLQRWLREEKGINIAIQHWNCMWMFQIQYIMTCYNGKSRDNFKTYEQALEVGLFEALQTLKR